MASGPNPVEVYQAALAQLRPILATGSGTPDSSTPCSEWNVQSLVNHAIAVQNFAFTVLGSGTPDPSSISPTPANLGGGFGNTRFVDSLC